MTPGLACAHRLACLHSSCTLALLQRWSTATLFSAFHAWMLFAAEAARQRSVMGAALHRLHHRTAIAAFAAWREAAAVRAEQHAKIQISLTRLSQQVCSLARHRSAPLGCCSTNLSSIARTSL